MNHTHRHHIDVNLKWVAALALVLSLLAALLPGARPAFAGGGDERHLKGIVISAPGSGGVGTWIIKGRMEGEQGDREWTVIADSGTEFQDGVPIPGNQVRVDGEMAGSQLWAKKIVIIDGGGHGGESETKGVVLTTPGTANGIGNWTIQADIFQTVIVIADANTRFDQEHGGVPRAGDWVEVKGQVQADGSILATRIKIDDYEGAEVVVRLRDGAIAMVVAIRHGLTVREALLSSGDIYLFGGDQEFEDMAGVIGQLQADADVIWAERNYVGGALVGDPYQTWGWGGVEPTEYVNQDAFPQVRLDVVGDRFTGDNVVVAVLDTGVDLAHPAFAERLLPGLDLVDDDTVPDEVGSGLGWGHGTHTSGVIAHMAPNSKLLPVRVLDANARGNTFILAYGVEWAVNHGADVINLSLGTPYDSQTLRQAVADAQARGVTIIAAAGNNADDAFQYPAAYPGVIAVTAVDGENIKPDFANYGADWVDIAAPGVGIVSTIVGPEGSGYATWSGTSMAAPFVSGAAARLVNQQPDATPSAIATALMDNVQDLDATNPSFAGQIGGLLDVAAALGVEAVDPGQASVKVYMPVIKSWPVPGTFTP
jgi:hypothetical protein